MKLESVLALLERAREEAAKMGVPMSFAVVDAGGSLVALTRMDGASSLTATVATNKAWTAAASGRPTASLVESLQQGMHDGSGSLMMSMSVSTGGRFMAAAGALPIREGAEVVGAIGASGGTAEQDVTAAQVALDTCSSLF